MRGGRGTAEGGTTTTTTTGCGRGLGPTGVAFTVTDGVATGFTVGHPDTLGLATFTRS